MVYVPDIKSIAYKWTHVTDLTNQKCVFMRNVGAQSKQFVDSQNAHRKLFDSNWKAASLHVTVLSHLDVVECQLYA